MPTESHINELFFEGQFGCAYQYSHMSRFVKQLSAIHPKIRQILINNTVNSYVSHRRWTSDDEVVFITLRRWHFNERFFYTLRSHTQRLLN
jgi:hypothetical protein